MLNIGVVRDSAIATNGFYEEIVVVGMAMVGLTMVGLTMVGVVGLAMVGVVGMAMEGVAVVGMAMEGMATGVVAPENYVLTTSIKRLRRNKHYLSLM